MDYNYLEAETQDVMNYINEEIDFTEYNTIEDLEEHLNDTLFVEDSVTGNASGSYTFNTYKAEEYLMHNLDLLGEACEEFGSGCDILKDGAEACDVTIRCYLLGQAISAALEEIEDDFNAAHEDADEEEPHTYTREIVTFEKELETV